MQTENGPDEFIFLVGAPQANDSNYKVEQPGQIQKCRFSLDENCEQLNMSLSTAPTKNQWLGVTLLSEKKKTEASVIVCAHRFHIGTYFSGVCYILENDLTGPQKFLTNVRGDHTEYGSSQTGTSAVFVPSGKNVQTFGVGAPGVLNWRGTIYSKVIAFIGGDTTTKESELGDEIKANSFVGYSITTGQFDSKGNYYATGAPRSNGTGQVLLVSHRKPKMVYLEHNALKTLSGDQFGSSFGYSVVAVDLNKDGYHDLIVGAPFYQHPKKGGAIYIYMGVPNGEMNENTVPIKILSRTMNELECHTLGCEHGRFGAALANADDLNQDGYEDLLVGAPYEGDGAVYVFHGSKDGIVEKPTQRIAASNLQHHSFKAFGSSFATGMDIDKNGYPDVLVGAFESDSLALLLSRPVLTLASNIKLSPKSIDLKAAKTCPSNIPAKHCITVKLCLKYTATITLSETPEIKYTIIAERFDPKVIHSRALFHNEKSAPSFEITGTIKLKSKGDEFCATHYAFLQSSFRDKLSPIKFQFSYKLKGKPLNRNNQLPQINAFPILDLTTAEETTEIKEIDIQKECGVDNVCQSDLTLTAIPLNATLDPVTKRYVLSSKDSSSLLIRFTVTNSKEPAYDTKLNLKVPENVIYQGVDYGESKQPVECSSKKNDVIVCDRLGNPFLPKTELTFIVKLVIQDAKPTNFLNLEVNLTTISEEQTPEDNEVDIAFEMLIITDIQVTGQSSPEQVVYTGNALGESAMKNEDDIGPVVSHIYDVYNKGSGTVPQSKLTIEWPYELASDEDHGKHLLYLLQPPKVEEGKVTCRHPTIINPASIKLSGKKATTNKVVSYNRKRRSLPKASKITVGSAQRKTSQDVSCDSGAKCYRIVCDIGSLEEGKSAVIVIRSRLWEATLLEEFKNADEVSIRSRATFEITAENIEIQETDLRNNVYDVVTVAIPDIDVSLPPPVPWWIILIAVVIGLLFLFLLGFLLWKCGFFKRRNREQMKSYNAIVEKNPDDFRK
ncbi:integrin alpha-PS1-like isoform X2 [Octopus vulgaris]|nr:integrin alpha-PS1-like isoform X2 [Octopus vulgaris]